MKKIGLVLLLVLLVGCNTDTLEENIKQLENEIESYEQEVILLEGELVTKDTLIQKAEEDYKLILAENIILMEESKEEPIIITTKSSSTSLLATALDVMDLIEAQDFVSLSSYVDPSEGLRFSPYSYIDFSSDLLFTPTEVSNFATDTTLYNWGTYDGSGDPISLQFNDYYNEFIYDHTYTSPHLIGNNIIVGTGNMINNLTTVYPTESFVEFHFTGFNPAYTGMDWSSLRLIFKYIGGSWKLININHDQWTT